MKAVDLQPLQQQTEWFRNEIDRWMRNSRPSGIIEILHGDESTYPGDREAGHEAARVLTANLAVLEALATIRSAVETPVRPEQAADYILSRAGFSEREIQIATKVAVDATNKERARVLALLDEVKG